MTYPSSTDYVSAVQDPRALVDADLRRARLVVDPILQIPMPASGNSAVVFKATIGNRSHALRFFIREDASSRERYRGLRTFLVAHGLTDCTATTQWVDDAIVIRAQRWPMVNMEWVEGRTLDAYIDHLVESGNTAALADLALAWRELIRRMQAEGFAHSDLQHGNVLVDTESRLRLVDFDGSWFTGVTGPVPTETGHPNYQRRDRPWDRWMDTFPGLLVYLALRSLARRPGLWRTFSGRENILFAKDDFIRPFDTEIWSALLAIGDPEITQGLSQLRAACVRPGGLDIPLESLLAEAPVRTEQVEEPRTPPVAGSVPLPPGGQWWMPVDPPAAAASSSGPPGSTTTLPPPPPKSPFAQPTDDGFAAGHAPAGWFAPGSPSSGEGRAGPGRGRPAPPPPGRPPTGRVPQPPGWRPPPPPPRRSRAWVWVPVAVLALAVLVAVIGLAGSGSSGGGTGGGGGAYPTPVTDYSPELTDPPTTEPATPTPEPPTSEPPTPEELLLQHVPTEFADRCEAYGYAPAKVVAALECETGEPITLRYYQYGSTTDMDAAFDADYTNRTDATGSCEDGEEGTSEYEVNGAAAGRYSCYASESGGKAMSWTHDETGILTLALSATSSFVELWGVADRAGPL